MGISEQTFNDLFIRMKHLTGLNAKDSSTKYFYDEFARESLDVIEKAFECMIQNPPPKINKEHIVNAIIEAKKKLNFDGKPVWNGIECEECIYGLVHTKQSNGNNYVWRCRRCNSRIEQYPFYTPDAVDELERRISKKVEKPEFFDGLDQKPEPVGSGPVVLNVAKNLKEENRKDLV